MHFHQLNAVAIRIFKLGPAVIVKTSLGSLRSVIPAASIRSHVASRSSIVQHLRVVPLVCQLAGAAPILPPNSGALPVTSSPGTTIRVIGEDFAASAGGVPIAVRGIGVVGAASVSGLPDKEDHGLVANALRRIRTTRGAQ
ncbi:hypothetical protein VW35_10845 [Devosia soli]|uniref:Uncharacterized protein n=2 Tax=Devosia soli TaxID=361041 RepID=A0A0F5L9R2_9HYPH|nr:hypothetical protein VW35_10845 [Devosia soli]